MALPINNLGGGFGGPVGFGGPGQMLPSPNAQPAVQPGGPLLVNSLGPSGQPSAPLVAPPPQLPAAPQTGLIGSEQALMQGLTGAQGALLTGAEIGRSDIQQGIAGGLGQLGQAQQQIGQQIGQGQQILGQAGQQITGIFDQGVAGLNPFISPGQQAQQQQAAISGALGPEAQAAAFAAFQQSPEQAFLREEAERGTVRNAAALGGLGGGNVRRELQRQAVGLAAQDLQNRFSRLGAVTGTGLQAAGQVGQLRGQQAGLAGQLAGQGAQLAGQQAGITGQLGQFGAGLFEQGGVNLANIAGATGAGISALIGGTGQQLAAGRTRAGEQIAGAVGGTSSALSNLLNQQGAGAADIIGAGGQNLANILQNSGLTQAQQQQALAALLNANAAQSGQAALPGKNPVNIPASQTAGQLAQLGQGIAGGLTAFNQAQQPPPQQTGFAQIQPNQAATINTGSQFGGFA